MYFEDIVSVILMQIDLATEGRDTHSRHFLNSGGWQCTCTVGKALSGWDYTLSRDELIESKEDEHV